MLSLFPQTCLAEIVTFCAQFFIDRDPSSLAESEMEPITELLRELGSLVMGVEAPPWIELRAVSVVVVVILGIGVNKVAERGVCGESSKRIIAGEIKCRIKRVKFGTGNFWVMKKSKTIFLQYLVLLWSDKQDCTAGCERLPTTVLGRVGGLIFLSCFAASFERWGCERLPVMLELREVVDCEKFPAVKDCQFCTLWRRRR
ncbi:hypothetical protein Adt_19218 [Abeliophyllum distichum]|uniref:Uncharacterized protein n=1 Tax=Abeliophyllum distichum TaxID=126358 RepID=A0ABD1SSD2_9LAMI